MKFALGFVAGLAAAWATLAIWQRVPEIGPIDAGDDVWEPRHGDRRPPFGDASIDPLRGGCAGFGGGR